jgi:hypothetical protein
VANDKLMRDPCVIRGADGQFHMVWTVSWNDKGIGYASTRNFQTWSEQRFISVMAHEDSARNAWAPEITYDPFSKQYMIYWASTSMDDFRKLQHLKASTITGYTIPSPGTSDPIRMRSFSTIRSSM